MRRGSPMSGIGSDQPFLLFDPTMTLIRVSDVGVRRFLAGKWGLRHAGSNDREGSTLSDLAGRLWRRPSGFQETKVRYDQWTKNSMTTKHVIVSGQVQGVWYRAWTRKQAETRGISGWVRNRSDGSVEALLSGEDEAVEAMIEALHGGPDTARVVKVQVRDADAPAESGFQVTS
ncbi:acylphosphatase [Sulfitobacter sp. D35]|uniref:acylphosphatase n=1 Tax=Sulfitobacter sp. D35 TaxID=3083252 RepID=UPI00296F9896|nr:acylphosphatase [Sulfitobacter sp. D35]MDW4499912.1 acylphosphatase [Sulfitobacter sp. D35]